MRQFYEFKSTREQILFSADATTVVSIGLFPVGAQISVNVTVDEAFDNANTIIVGTNVDDDALITSLNVTTLTGKNSDRRFITKDNEREIIATISGSATAGAVTVSVDYILPSYQSEVSY